MRCIDADALRDRLQNLGYDDWNQGATTTWAEAFNECADMVDEQPTIEPRCEVCEAFNKTRLLIPQPERTGRWINHVEDGYVECPFCHSATNCDDNISELHFCFSCGARMEGGQE